VVSVERNYENIEYFVNKLKNGQYEYRDGQIYNTVRGRMIKGSLRGGKVKYLAMSSGTNGKNFRSHIHLVVFAYFHGIDELKKHENIDHINNNRFDNRIENLQGLTHLENSIKGAMQSALAHRKLTEEEVRSIRSSDKTDTELSKLHSVSRKTIYEIKKGLRYKQFL
jgi:hypothetical protein